MRILRSSIESRRAREQRWRGPPVAGEEDAVSWALPCKLHASSEAPLRRGWPVGIALSCPIQATRVGFSLILWDLALGPRRAGSLTGAASLKNDSSSYEVSIPRTKKEISIPSLDVNCKLGGWLHILEISCSDWQKFRFVSMLDWISDFIPVGKDVDSAGLEWASGVPQWLEAP